MKAKPALTRLSLEGNEIGAKGAVAIAKALAGNSSCVWCVVCRSLTRFCSVSAENKALTDLNLSGAALTAAAVAPLMESLKNKALLHRLALLLFAFDLFSHATLERNVCRPV